MGAGRALFVSFYSAERDMRKTASATKRVFSVFHILNAFLSIHNYIARPL